MSFSTNDEIRSEAGFQNNPDVKNDLISKYKDQAYNEVLSIVSNFYEISYFISGSSDYDAANFEGSPAESYLKRSEELIGAGYLQLKLFGNQQLYEDNSPYTKINEGRQRLTDLINTANPLKLIGNDGQQFPILSKDPINTDGTIAEDCQLFSTDETR